MARAQSWRRSPEKTKREARLQRGWGVVFAVLAALLCVAATAAVVAAVGRLEGSLERAMLVLSFAGYVAAALTSMIARNAFRAARRQDAADAGEVHNICTIG